MEPEFRRSGPSRSDGVRPRPVVLSREALVDTRRYADEEGHVLLVRPSLAPFDLAPWAAAQRAWIDDQLAAHGGLLFRGFHIAAAETLDAVISAVAGEALPYGERSSPRTQVAGNVYTSTEQPPDQEIFLHNENSYRHEWPQRVFFCCVTSADKGGRTPIADVRRVYARIDPEIRARFAARQVMYVRNFGGGLGLSWQQVFQTTDPAVVEAYCRDAGIQCTWRAGDRLTTRQVRPAIARHPRTGELVWFNHATFFHVSTLEPTLRQALTSYVAEDDWPNHVYYGDGQPIEEEVMDHLREAYRTSMRVFEWERGDLLLLDNLLMAHGREPFTGARRILVGLAAPMAWRDAVVPSHP